ncbi:MAG: leucyl aminopeptidase [Candidatus Gastranaerophilaceae bacterium]|jgi:leucyl aminopeptidase
MEIKLKQGSLTQQECDVVIVNIFEKVKKPEGATGEVDKALDGLISDYIIEQQDFNGKFGEIIVIPTYGKIPAKKVLVAGLGKAEEFDLNKIRLLSSKIIKKCKTLPKVKKICSLLHGGGIGGLNPYNCAKVITEGTLLGSYSFDKYKSEKNEDKKIAEFEIVEIEPSIIDRIKEGIENGKIVSEEVNFARDLVNEPADEMTPTKLAQIALKLKGVETKIMDKDEVQKLGMGSYLAVAKGSTQPPKFIHMEYKPSNPKKKIAIVGKGVTFDSGGLDIKPASSMLNMKDDMAGAAAVIGVIKAISKLKPNVEVHAIIAATENMPGPQAYKPGDVVKAMNGKTIEIDNTDAEGRLTLADALCYAESLKVDEIIDIATLTGACMAALGYMASGIVGNNDELVKKLIKAADDGGERLWEFPMYEEYFEGLKSEIADFKNSGTKFAGTSVAGLFLQKFVSATPWAHIDIAGPSFLGNEVRELSKGASGVGVRTLINYILQ